MRVLFVSPHFPPDSRAATHRARLLAPRLAAHGWTPTVLTVRTSPDDRDVDPDLRVPDDLEVVRVVPIAERLTRPLGVGDLGLRALPALLAEALRLSQGRMFDALYVTLHPTYSTLVGPLLRLARRIPFVLDYQDPWVGAWGATVGGAADGGVDTKSRASRALSIPLEAAVAHAASAFTAVSAGTLTALHARWPALATRPFLELPIGFDAEDAVRAEAVADDALPFDPNDGLVHLCHVGTLLPLAREPLVELLRALALFRERSSLASRVRLHFIGTSNQVGPALALRVRPVARELGVHELVDEQPARVPYFSALAAQQRAGGNLVLGSTEPHYTASKMFPVLLARRPLLVSCHVESSLCDLFRRAVPDGDGWLHAFRPEAPPDLAALATQLEQLVVRASGGATRPDLDAIEDASAPVLAGRLAVLLDRVRR